MKIALVTFLLVWASCSAQVGPLEPVGEFWSDTVREKYPEFSDEKTKLFILNSPSFPHIFMPETIICLVEAQGQYELSLRDVTDCDEACFSFQISESAANRLIEIFSFYLTHLEDDPRSGADGTIYILKIQGSGKQTGYTWNPEVFTEARDFAVLVSQLRSNCIRCINDEFTLDEELEELFEVYARTPDQLRWKYIEAQGELLEDESADPFTVITDEMKKQQLHLDYLKNSLYLKFEHERRQLAAGQDQ
ncbi:MAG: hypothetical protein Q7Q73_12885 [Verrucomicrobiota bacterium JB024]|nr:hypothetical protein [Verrucomicrobiota bacterium JB024]